MAISVGDLIAKLKVDTSDLDKLPTAVDRAGVEAKRRFDNIALGMAAAGAAITVGAALAGNAMVDSAKQAGKWAETLQQTSDRTGLSINELSGLFVGLNRTNLDFTSVEMGFRKLSKEFEAAKEKMKEGQTTFELFGKTFAGSESPGEVFRAFADAVKDAGSPLERVNLAGEIFGTRVGQKMIPLLKDGAAGFDAMMKAAQAMGLMIDPGTVEKMGTLDDKFDDVQGSLKGLTTALGVQSEPGATRWADLQIGAIQAVTNTIQGLPSVISSSLGVLVEGGLIMGPVLVGMAAFLKSWQLVQPVIVSIGAFLATPAGMFLALAAAVYIAYSNLDQIHVVLRDIGGRFNKFIGENINAFIEAVKNFGRNVAGYFVQLKDKAIQAMSSMVDGINLYLGEKMSAIFERIREPIQKATQWFKDMYIAVVGRSYIPDMVDEIGQHMSKLDSNLAAPARAAAISVEASFQGLQITTAGIMQTIAAQGSYAVGNAIQTASSAIASSIQGLNTWSQAGQAILNSFLQTAVTTAMNIAANWVIAGAVQLLSEEQKASAMTAVHTAMEGAKTAATASGEAARLGIAMATNKVMMAGVIATLGGIAAVGTAALGKRAARAATAWPPTPGWRMACRTWCCSGA